MPVFTSLPTNDAQVDMTLLINPKNVMMFGKEQNEECSVPIREGSGIENVAVAYLPYVYYSLGFSEYKSSF